MAKESNPYDQYAEEYAKMLSGPNGADISRQPITSYLLDYIGDIHGLTVLDAGCGEGYLSRILASRGATIIGIDIAPRLIAIARSKDPEGLIEYRVADLSQPYPEFDEYFDIVASNLVLNDVPDYLGYISTLGSIIKENGRAVLSMNNPYSAVIREKVGDYFDSGTSILYQGLVSRGIKVYYFHRTLEEYIAAFRENGFLLRNLCDVCPAEAMLQNDDPVSRKHYHFPFFMILEFIKVK